ncbi:IscS subfamily cysteine desulfurase [bacterium (Candidatus Blackallbacteria) CG17_big_fil_post_rev_8_21_14_2_50_48_46]|uniref:cysteine desulfurase n=1 Tax=bacterium (Candidatus Blackallbacteria) CG17_big_fil_post_rev_8_21_14_2_50_48_46 TaxID=2014261 RepID=A0A2M7G8K1_9BACT|nr:MAG: IscS subfamily cysteine desulfurase [bacterium (Candidatus Blackallbacteria) CG18_big_fil_WC_8_21_14_2_50_49_26]PIW18435.1 MAG: IscS subfamily cysteine desulfurase [bacterium (Candidatus Blackallbacteria) CG17_big_fil_post_rev_8_21_14_2_50_48_46]PIW46580.1 MAG: IscS subfamily cysteine desulfurase [bacterium (Candidatus Blackallbacteria) CG13_big_fil_rev_8_21_14_2_50_49_14]
MQKPIYLDYCATTPLDPRILPEMLPWFSEQFGNPANLTHAYGREALLAVHRARERIAALIGAKATEIFFTSGASESNNLVFKGLAHLAPEKNQVMTVATEHKSVLCSAQAMAERGFDVEILPVDSQGRVNLERLSAQISEKTALVSVMAVNNEVGTLQPIEEIGKICTERQVLFHCDAVQAGGKLPINVDDLKIDLLSLSAHKMYGPKGVGCLYLRQKSPAIPLRACIEGGGQEFGLRAGTLNVPAIVGFGLAAEWARSEQTEELARLKLLRQRLWEGIQAGVSEVKLSCDLDKSSPAILHLCFGGLKKGKLVGQLKDLAVSTGSACSSGSGKASYVLDAMGLPESQMDNPVRFSLGRFTQEEEIEMAIQAVIRTIQTLRENPSRIPF